MTTTETPATPAHITRDAIVAFIRANEHRANPGAVLPLRFGQAGACRYFDEPDPWGDVDPVPSCVIGNVLAQFGITPRLYSVPNESAFAVFNFLADGGVLTTDEGVGDFATDVQSFADRGYTWGTALQLALIERGEA